jgi:hypothetical protein
VPLAEIKTAGVIIAVSTASDADKPSMVFEMIVVNRWDLRNVANSRCDMLRRHEEIQMATKKKRQKKSPRNRPEATPETEDGAPSGRGGVAMGRTVGLPFGGARARRRKASDKRGDAKAK